jgi:AAA+ ATPase superfamily predicted ATPase
MFIGRNSELATLNDLYKTDVFQLVVMYGRRRVGKTKLLLEFCKDKDAFFFVAEEHNNKMALAKFSELILKESDLKNIIESFEDWEKALQFIATTYNGRRMILVLDEFPYLVTSDKSLPSLLQNMIDHIFKETDLFIVICGSSMSFIEKEVLSYKSPLYGRRTAQMKIEPFNCFDSAKFYKKQSKKEKFEIYSILGGIPQYLLEFDDSKSLESNIKEKMLKKSTYLYNEPNDLLKQELREPFFYNSIIQSIAAGSTKLNQIATKVGESTAKVSRYLTLLEELYIVKKIIPIGGQKSTRKAIYQLNDNLFSFYYKFIFPNKGLIEQEMSDVLYDEYIKNGLSEYFGLTFEILAKEYLLKMNKRIQLPFVFTNIGKWWGNNAIERREEEIDVVAFSTDKIIFAECKWINSKVSLDVMMKLKAKSDLIKGYSERYYYVFSKSGFTKGLIDYAKLNNNLYLITIDDMPL